MTVCPDTGGGVLRAREEAGRGEVGMSCVMGTIVLFAHRVLDIDGLKIFAEVIILQLLGEF